MGGSTIWATFSDAPGRPAYPDREARTPPVDDHQDIAGLLGITVSSRPARTSGWVGCLTIEMSTTADMESWCEVKKDTHQVCIRQEAVHHTTNRVPGGDHIGRDKKRAISLPLSQVSGGADEVPRGAVRKKVPRFACSGVQVSRGTHQLNRAAEPTITRISM